MATGNLVVKQGTTTTITIPNVKDANGTLITNWAGYTLKAQVRDRVESSTVLHEWTTFTTSGSDIKLSVSAATSTAWTWTSGRYDVELANPSGQVARIAEGHITVDREVTR